MCRCDAICAITHNMYRCKVGNCIRCTEHYNICHMVYNLDVDFVIYYSEGEC